MALEYGRLFAPKALTTSAASMFVLGAAGDGRVLRNGAIRVTNTNAATARIVTGYIIPNGDTAAADTEFLQESIPANSSIDVSLPKMIGGDDLQMKQDTGTDVTVMELDGVVRV